MQMNMSNAGKSFLSRTFRRFSGKTFRPVGKSRKEVVVIHMKARTRSATKKVAAVAEEMNVVEWRRVSR